MESDITEFIQTLAEMVPCVLRIDVAVHGFSHCEVVLHCVEGLQVTEMVSMVLLERKDSGFVAMLCEDLRSKIVRALTEHRAEQWQAQKSAGQGVALLEFGEFHGQMAVALPPPTELSIGIAGRIRESRTLMPTRVQTRLMFVLVSYDPVTRVAVYRS